MEVEFLIAFHHRLHNCQMCWDTGMFSPAFFPNPFNSGDGEVKFFQCKYFWGFLFYLPWITWTRTFSWAQQVPLPRSVFFTAHRRGFWRNFFAFLFWSIWDSLMLLNNSFFCMWWRDKVALNVSSHPIRGSPCQGPGEPPLSTPPSLWR